MPKIETIPYAAERGKWQTAPQALIRFYHVPTAELLIATTSTRPLIASQEGVDLGVFKGIREGTGADAYDFAQGFIPVNALRREASLEVDLTLIKNGAPSGNVVVAIHASIVTAVAEIPPNSATVDNGYTVRLADGTLVRIFSNTQVNGATVPQSASVGALIHTPDGGVPDAILNVGTFIAPPGSPSDVGTYLHDTIPAHDEFRPQTTAMANGTGTIDVSLIATANWHTVVFPRTAKPALVAGSVYWIVVSASYAVSVTNHIRIKRSEPGAYTSGVEAVNTQAAPTTWTMQNGIDLLFRVAESIVNVNGVLPTQYPFSRDFSSGPIVSPDKPYLECIEMITGSTQTVVPHEARSSAGQLTFYLVDRGGPNGDIMKQCGAFPMRVNAMTATSPAVGGFVVFNETTAVVDRLPSIGTLTVRTKLSEQDPVDGNCPVNFSLNRTTNKCEQWATERIRYSAKDAANVRVTVAARGVDGTTPIVHNANDLAANGEQIRQGQRMTLFLLYQGMPSAQKMQFYNWEVTGRRARGAGWEITVSDMQHHLNKTVFTQATRQKPYKVRGNPVDLMLNFLMSTGAGVNGAFDVWPADASLGLPSYFLDVTAFTNLKAASFPNDVWEFSITGPAIAKQWMEEQFFKACGCFPFVTQQGLYSVKKLKTASAPGSVAQSLGEADIIDFDGIFDGVVINQAVVEYDYDTPDRPGDFAIRQIITADESVLAFGKRAPWTLRGFGLRSKDGAEPFLDRVLTDIFRRYGTSEAPPMIRLFLPYKQHQLDIGDEFKLTHSLVPTVAGSRGVVNAVCEVQDVSAGFLTQGRVTITAMYTGGLPTLTGGLSGDPIGLGPGAGDGGELEIPPPSGIRLVVAGTEQSPNEHTFHGRDITVRWNAARPLNGQQQFGQNPDGTGIEVAYYEIQTLSLGTSAGGGPVVLMLRRTTHVPATEVTYDWLTNSADHGGTPARTITGRWWTVLTDGRRSPTYTEFTATNPAPSMAGFTPSAFQTEGSGGANSGGLDWGAWPRTDPDLEKFAVLYAYSGQANWVPGMTPDTLWTFKSKDDTVNEVRGLTPGQTIRSMVVPYDAFGAGTPSEIVEVVIVEVGLPPPTTPTGLSVATGFDPAPTQDGGYTVWAEATCNRNADSEALTHVTFRGRRNGSTDEWQYWGTPFPATGNPIRRISGLPPGIQIETQVHAANAGGFSAWSASTITTLSVWSGDPGQVVGLSVSPLPNGNRITWTPVAIPDILHYEVHEGGSGFAISGSGAPGNGTSIANTGGATYERIFPAGTTYPITRYYRIVAVRTSGDRGQESSAVGTTVTGTGTTDITASAITQQGNATSTSTTALTTSYASYLSVAVAGIRSGAYVLVMAWADFLNNNAAGIDIVQIRLREAAGSTVSNAPFMSLAALEEKQLVVFWVFTGLSGTVTFHLDAAAANATAASIKIRQITVIEGAR